MVWVISACVAKSRVDFINNKLFEASFKMLWKSFNNERLNVFKDSFDQIAESVGILTKENVVGGIS